MNILFLDDNREDQRIYGTLIQSIFFKDTLTIFTKTKDLENSTHFFDLAIIDLHLMDGDGIQVINENRDRFGSILILTAHVNRMVECFGRNVIGFIEKKKSTDEFLDKLRKIKKELKQEKALSARCYGQDVSIRISQIRSIQRIGRKIFLKTLDGLEYEAFSYTLDDLETLTEDKLIRIDRSILINPSYVVVWPLHGPIKMDNGDLFYPSRRKAQTAYEKYLELV